MSIGFGGDGGGVVVGWVICVIVGRFGDGGVGFRGGGVMSV